MSRKTEPWVRIPVFRLIHSTYSFFGKHPFGQVLFFYTESEVSTMEKLEEICKPLIEYIRQNHNPHTEIVVTSDSITVKQNIIGIPEKRVTE